MEFLGKARDWARGCPLWDLVYPRESFLTGEPVEATSPLVYLNEREMRQVILARPPHCTTCGHPFWGQAEPDQVCPHCIELKPVFGEGRTAALMQGPARRMIIELKYHEGLYMVPELVKLACACPGYLDFLEGARLVPVPLHWYRYARRGYNQSALLARELAAVAKGCEVRELLRRKKYTSSQTRLQRKERARNMRGAFQAITCPGLERNRRIVLIDDVFTTGSTLNACARALNVAGFPRIDVATFCHG